MVWSAVIAAPASAHSSAITGMVADVRTLEDSIAKSTYSAVTATSRPTICGGNKTPTPAPAVTQEIHTAWKVIWMLMIWVRVHEFAAGVADTAYTSSVSAKVLYAFHPSPRTRWRGKLRA